MVDQWVDVVLVQVHYGVVVVLVDYVQWVVWVGYGVDVIVLFDFDLLGVFVLLCFEGFIEMWMIEYGGVEDCLWVQQVFVW